MPQPAEMAPEFRPVLQALAAAPKIADSSVEQARAMWEAFLPGEPEPLEDVADLDVPGQTAPIPARLYLPSKDPAGLVLFLHGGGWVLGGLRSHDIAVRSLAKRSNWAVLAIEYRLAPESPFPAGLEDCYAALGWLAEKRVELGRKDWPIIVAGDSAGGNLAAALAILVRDRLGPQLAGQVLIYPATDGRTDTPSYAERGEGGLLTARDMRWFWNHYAPGELALEPLASPILQQDLSGLAAAAIVTAEFDPLRDEGGAYADALRASGVPVQHLHFPDLPHGFLTFAPISPSSDRALSAIAGVFASFERHRA